MRHQVPDRGHPHITEHFPQFIFGYDGGVLVVKPAIRERVSLGTANLLDDSLTRSLVLAGVVLKCRPDRLQRDATIFPKG